MPNLLFARSNGELIDLPGMKMAGRSGDSFLEPLEEELMPLPEGATLTAVPQRFPVGIDRVSGEFSRISVNPFRNKKEEVWAVAALLPQGFSRTLLPAFSGWRGKVPLPLMGYTAVGLKDGNFVVAARQTDEDRRWNPVYFNTPDLEERVEERQRAFPANRLIRQLAHCSLEYGCLTAQNVFYRRWEAGIPVSPHCNARCVGCISAQPSECCPSPQRRLDFIPSPEEVWEIALPHLSEAEDGIISFGQGCEGEPSLQSELIAKSIRMIREREKRGTININTNGGNRERIKAIVDAGLDAMRLSLISPEPSLYQSYHRPQGYTLKDVMASLKYASAAGVFVSLNLLAFPGVTDREREVAGLIQLIQETGVRKIQIRNLNIDPDLFMELAGHEDSPALGLEGMIRVLRDELPALEIGNFSRPVR